MDNDVIKVLLVEDNPGDARLIAEMLGESGTGTFALEHVDRLDTALEHLARKTVDVALLDLSLPDSRGLETLSKAQEASPVTSMIVLTGLDDGSAALIGRMALVAASVAKERGIATDGYRLSINQGPNSGQVFDHLHMHLLGGQPLGELA